MPAISVIVPVYNNEKYAPLCVQSLLSQTFRDIEIICINDGSTDRSSEILHSFADEDSRVIVIDKENAGYGVAINTGLSHSKGKYVTILESDDFADLDMLETLYAYAEQFDLDIVRANFYLYWSSRLKKDRALELFPQYECDRIVNPSKNAKDRHCFYVQPALWSALYKKSFISDNGLRLLETPGAAYQDTAFNFKLWACAERVMFIRKPFVHYRQDNESSSINDKSKVYNICWEYEEINRWLSEDRPEKRAALAPIMWKMMCDAYEWNTGRVSDDFKLDFVERFAHDFSMALDLDEIDPNLFMPGQLSIIKKTINDPQGYIDYITKGVEPDKGAELIFRKARTLNQVRKMDGFSQMVSCIKERMLNTESAPTIVDRIDAELSTRKSPVYIKDKPRNPEISVVLTVYNTASCLREALDSILAQTFLGFELIVIDDGSTDGSPRILKEYQNKDARIAVYRQDNQGVSYSRNKGIDLATAPYLLILDSDDIFMPEMFEKLLKQAKETKSDLVVCESSEYHDEDHEVIPMDWALRTELLPDLQVFSYEDMIPYQFKACMGWPWDRLYKTEFIRQHGFRFPILPNSEDLVFVYDAFMKAERVSVVKESLIKHRVDRKGSISNSRLSNPTSFYDAVVLLKTNLKQDRDAYGKMEKGFLNWALDYALWNILSLPEQELKLSLGRMLFNGEFPELEFKERPSDFFDLYPDIADRVNQLSRSLKRSQ